MTDLFLTDRLILVVEDELLLSMDICAQVEDHGGTVLGPASTMQMGQALLRAGQPPDGAILNIQVAGQPIYPLADELLVAHVPIVFASSVLKSEIPARFADIPLLSKPIDMVRVAAQLFDGAPSGRRRR